MTCLREGCMKIRMKKMNRKSKNTKAMPTDWDFAPLISGVSVSTAATMIMQIPIPIAPTIKRNFRPNRSVVQVALSVNKMPKVAFSALMRSVGNQYTDLTV